MHEYFNNPGVTDQKAQTREAQKLQKKGEDALVHDHKAGEFCNHMCMMYHGVKEG